MFYNRVPKDHVLVESLCLVVSLLFTCFITGCLKTMFWLRACAWWLAYFLPNMNESSRLRSCWGLCLRQRALENCVSDVNRQEQEVTISLASTGDVANQAYSWLAYMAMPNKYGNTWGESHVIIDTGSSVLTTWYIITLLISRSAYNV